MSSIINTNTSSLTAQRNLSMSQATLATSMQRLSSGLRINSAKDDAAGLAISERFTTQIRGLNQAARNANDGISMAQTAEGALGEMNNNLQRIRELAVQSANATNSSSDRAAIDAEVQQRLAEIDRVASQTTFNGQRILDGSFGTATFQVGADVGQTIGVSLGNGTSMRQSALGVLATVTSTVNLNSIGSATPTPATYTTGVVSAHNFATIPATAGSSTVYFGTAGPQTTETVTVNGVTFAYANSISAITVNSANSVTVNFNFTGDSSPANRSAALSAAINQAVANPLTSAALAGLSASTVGTLTTITDSHPGLAATVGRTVTGNFAIIVLNASGTDANTSANSTNSIGATPITLNTNITSASDLISVLNAGAGGAYVAVAGAMTGTVQITSTATGVGSSASIAPTGAGVATLGLSGTAVDGAASGAVSLATGGMSVAIGSGSPVNVAGGTYTSAQSLLDAVNAAMGGDGNANLNTSTGQMTINSSQSVTIAGTDLATVGFTAGTTAASGSLANVDVNSVANANTAIRRVDSALTAVSSLRSTFGAIQNRFDSVIANLATTAENLSASRSRVQDADFAAETANLSRSQILQQAGTAMVAQANQLPQGVLALLR